MALNFSKKVKSKIEVTVFFEGTQAESAKVHLQDIADHTNLEELHLIAKVCKNSTIKSLALSKAKSYV